MEQLYLFEVLVDKITFGSTFVEIPDKKEIQVAVVFPHSGFSAFNEPFKPGIKIGSGKSHLFPCQANELYEAVTQAPLEFFVKLRHGEKIGCTTIPWSPEIVQMIDSSRINPNTMTSVSSMGTYDIVDYGTETIVGKINTFISLSCLGQIFQAQSRVLQFDNWKKCKLAKVLQLNTNFRAQQVEILSMIKNTVFPDAD